MKEKELFIQQVKEILDQVDDEFVEMFEFANYFKVHWIDQRFLLIPHSVSKQYVKALNILKGKAEYTDRPISEKEVEEMFDDFLMRMHHLKNDGALQSKETQNLFNSIKRAKISRYLIIIPLVRFHTMVDFKLGCVTIAGWNSTKTASIQAEYNVQFHQDDIDVLNQRIMRVSSQPTVSITVVDSSDERKAEYLAIQRTDQLLNVLRLFVPDFQGLIFGEALEEVDRTILIAEVLTNASHRIDERVNMRRPPDDAIDYESIDTFFKKNDLNKQQLAIIDRMLSKSPFELSRLQRDILTAIYWIGNSVKSFSIPDKFIKYIIALDTLLAQARRDKGETVARMFTAIMNKHSSNEEKLAVYNEIKHYYNIRNFIMHAGISEVGENCTESA